MHRRHFSLLLLLSFTLLSLFFVNIPVTPGYGTETTKVTHTLTALGIADTLLIDDNPDFTTPMLVEKNSELTFQPGTYYWKTSGLSLTSMFTIVPQVALDVQEQDDATYTVTNTGNTAADVAVEDTQTGLPVGYFVLSTNKELNLHLENETLIKGGQHDA